MLIGHLALGEQNHVFVDVVFPAAARVVQTVASLLLSLSLLSRRLCLPLPAHLAAVPHVLVQQFRQLAATPNQPAATTRSRSPARSTLPLPASRTPTAIARCAQ